MLTVDKKEIERNKAVWDENDYYHMAEDYIESQWKNLIWPVIKDCDFSMVVDLAAGHGRNTRKLLGVSKNIAVVDLSENNIEYCKNRFKDETGITYHACDGQSIPLWGDTYTLVYCFDAMVHFEPETVFNYLHEIYRVLVPGGRAFLHHSNNGGIVNQDWKLNPHARNYMTQSLFRYWAKKAGFKIIYSQIIDWVESKNLDCITVLEK
jgi:ubiquinone/menaquinone biosynthesis C-methylase UbiE